MSFLAQPAGNWRMALLGAVFVFVLIGVIYLFALALRKFLHRREGPAADDTATLKPKGDDPSAFMAASMQGVILKLREQEKELERLHRAEKERAEQTERLSEEVTRNMPAGLLLVSSAGIITSANPAAETAIGVRGLAYRRYTEALGENSAVTRLIGNCLAQGRTYRRQEIQHTTLSGEQRQLGVTISPVLHGAGTKKISGAICLLSDLTELAALQRQMRLKENLAALGELSAGIAHEFKNALATISGYAQMIRGEGGQDETSQYAERILDQTRTITHVITEFLKFARPFELADDQVEIRPLVERVAAEVRDAVSQVTVTAEGEFAQVSGDEGLLRQAILNLARNAAEASREQPSGGRVVLRGSLEKNGSSDVQRISVSDNGPGIPPADLLKIFRPFYTTKAKGTGLGLAVVQKIVVQHGGTVEARNQPQGGAEFILWVPLRRESAEAVDSVYGGI
ncbi:MAG TPA: ATP-binding protein [Candidatus Acidoferrales bacterium]|nr:ATP-binding protein [Candidatus Acidoferrales bacterium]